MIRLLLIALALWAGFAAVREGRRYLGSLPPERRQRLWVNGAVVIPIGAVLVLVALGRLPLIAAAAAAAWPLLRGALRLLAWLPAAERAYRQMNGAAPGARQARHRGPRTGEATMDEAQALAILDLQPGASRQQILDAHKRLARKVHPDQGGSTYLAAEINRARDFLLRRV